MSLILHRPMRDSDMPFVFATWLKWARGHAPWLRLLPDRVFWDSRAGYRAHVEELLRRSKSVVACDPECENMIFGYAVAELPNLLHFVFVDRDFRRSAGGRLPESVGVGMVRALLPEFGVSETVATVDRPAFSVLAARHRIRFDPLASAIVGRDFARWAEAWGESMTNRIVPRDEPVVIPDVDAELDRRTREICGE